MNEPATAIGTTRRLAAAVCAMALLLGACSSSADSTEAAEDATTAPEPTETPAADDAPASEEQALNSGDYDCEALSDDLIILRSASGWLPQVMDQGSQELLDAFGGDLDAIDEAIEGLRPIQDIDSVLGTGREGLDNMSADVAAIRAETYGESAGSYGVAALTAAWGEEICG